MHNQQSLLGPKKWRTIYASRPSKKLQGVLPRLSEILSVFSALPALISPHLTSILTTPLKCLRPLLLARLPLRIKETHRRILNHLLGWYPHRLSLWVVQLGTSSDPSEDCRP